jgi:DNA-binding transcriptional ArsR family regulator
MSSRSDIQIQQADTCDVIHIHPAQLAELRGRLVGSEDAADLAETFRTLGDPTRVRMLDALSQSELCVCDLAALIGLSESAVSHQLRLLRNLRLVKSRRDGRMVFYALDDRHIITLFRQGLRHVQETAAGRDRGSKTAHRQARGR